MPTGLYETDFYSWSLEQARLLRDGRASEADLANIAEEIESMGRSEKRELVNRLDVLLTHLIKWRHQPAFRGTSWRLTIEEQRDRLDEHLKDNPGLKPSLPEAFATAWRFALLGAQRETGLARSDFPARCPWTLPQATDAAFLPD